MNPALIILIIIAMILLWSLLSFVFKPLGKLVYKVYKNTFDVMDKEDTTIEEKEEK